MILRTIDTPEDFAALKDAWDELLLRSRSDTPFLSHEWLQAWWSSYADPAGRLAVLACFDGPGGRLTGAFPGYVEPGRGWTSGRRLHCMGDTDVGSAHLDCLADPESEAPAIDAIIEALLDKESGWDVIDLRDMRADGPFLARLLQRAEETGMPVVRGDQRCCPILPLAGTWEEFLATCSHKWRSTVRRRRREAASLGRVEVQRIDDPAALDAALVDTTRLFESSMSRKHGRPYTVSERYRTFVSSVARQFMARGWLELIMLAIDGERVAFVLGFEIGEACAVYQTGFAQEWAEHSVGTVVMSYAIEAAIEDGCTTLDFGMGDEEYKHRWGAVHTPNLAAVAIYPASPAGRMRASWDEASRWARKKAKELLPRGLAERVGRERSWRRLARF